MVRKVRESGTGKEKRERKRKTVHEDFFQKASAPYPGKKGTDST